MAQDIAVTFYGELPKYGAGGKKWAASTGAPS